MRMLRFLCMAGLAAMASSGIRAGTSSPFPWSEPMITVWEHSRSVGAIGQAACHQQGQPRSR